MFVRTGGCDYHCDWCDSAFTWDGSEKPKRMTTDEVIEQLDQLGTYDYVTYQVAIHVYWRIIWQSLLPN